MRAARVVRLDGPAAVRIEEVPEPVPADGQVLIEVAAAGVSFPDTLLTRGRYQVRPDLPFTLGAEVAGTVRAAPPDGPLAPGDRVAAFPGLGGMADRVVAAPDVVFPLPDRVSFEVAAAVPMNYLTAHFALVHRGRLEAGETVLVHGAAGGLGTAAVQLARILGARVLAVVSDAAKAEVARAAGAHHVLPVGGFPAGVRELTDGRGVDVVVDPVGGDRFTDSLRSLAPEGRLLVLGFAGGEIPTVRVNRLLLTNTTVVGVGWGAFALRRPGFARDQWAALLPHLESGAVDPPLGGTYPLERAAEAVADLDGRRATGKLVLRL